MADNSAKQAGLPDAVSPEKAGDLADFGTDRDAAQGLGGAVMQVDILDVQHRSSGAAASFD
jgi:hypothetical protein